MRCTQCGLPLSPSRTQCPRCGAAVGGVEKRPVGKTPFTADLSSQTVGMFPGGGPTGTESAQPPPGAYMPASPWDMQGPQGASAVPQMPFAQPNEQWPQQGVPPMGAQNQAWYAPAAAVQFEPSAANWMSQGAPAPSPTPPPAVYMPQNPAGRGKQGTRRGFTVAGLCLCAGAVILVFVAVLAHSLPASTSPSIQTTSAPTTLAKTTPVASTPTASLPTVTPSPTAFPAQQYITSAQMASAVDETTGLPVTLATSFKVSQKMYLTLALNSKGNSGAICMLWYINNQHLTADDFAIDVGATSEYAFTYIYPPTAGTGYVEVNWASTDKCTDMTLAQRVSFTVSA